MSSTGLEGRGVIVTGGGSGTGRASALEFADEGGVLDRLSPVADTDDDEWERVVRNDLTAPFLLPRAALPHMMAAGRGSIVFTASEASLRGSAAGAARTASQHGVVGLTKSLAVMYRGHGIPTNAIAPSPTYSGIQPVVFLASDAASNINGAVLPVDHGWSAV